MKITKVMNVMLVPKTEMIKILCATGYAPRRNVSKMPIIGSLLEHKNNVDGANAPSSAVVKLNFTPNPTFQIESDNVRRVDEI